MKQRTITAVLLILLLIPFVLFGGNFLVGLVIFISLLAIYELLTTRKKENGEKKKYPMFVVFLLIACTYLLVFGITIGDFLGNYSYTEQVMYSVNLSSFWIAILIGGLLATSVFKKDFEILDAFYLFTMTIFISLGLQSFLYIRTLPNNPVFALVKESDFKFSGIFICLYVILTTCMTDTGGYIGGLLCRKILAKKGKEPTLLIPRVSPKKTVEGFVVATIIGALTGSLVYGLLVCKYEIALPIYVYIPMSIVLALTAQLGDLIFSSIKRYFGIKDFGNLLPGHGGVLDRMDSLLFNSIIFASFFFVFIQQLGLFVG